MSLRQVVLDTETTGLSAEDGHRIVEIGCVEIVDRRLTGRTLHLYVNPEREIDQGALEVHGLTRERLSTEPRFAELADRVAEFVADAELLIHNAPFDMGFLESEFRRIGRPRFAELVGAVTDTLALARELHPGRRNSLDALCERYEVSNAHRKLHGALLDAELLADVYLAMTRGQDSLEIALGGHDEGAFGADADLAWPPVGLIVVRADEAELRAHAEILEAIAREARKPALWTRLAAPEMPAVPVPPVAPADGGGRAAAEQAAVASA
ncbi:MAG TPA: DNA polymerase III subunit epsilon [Burkholderiaceae bacterium]|nr:DNA polymerase III subunit epsilon [Burkholderiaceae bacterium]